MSATKSITVVLPFFNARRTLDQAISSVLDTPLDDLEIIAIDDGSDDGSADILAMYSGDDRLRVVRQANTGLAGALNVGVRLAAGPYIARMDADDVCRPDRLARQAAFLDANSDVVLVGGQIERLVDGRSVSRSDFPLGHAEIVRGLVRGEHVLCHPAVMFRRDAVLKVGGYWEHGVAEDWDLFLKLASVGRLSNISDVVLDYRYHGAGINATSMTQVRSNIRLAIHNHQRRADGQSEEVPDSFLAGSSAAVRLAIRMEATSLAVYRHALQIHGNGRLQLVASRALLLLAGIVYPPFATRRVRRALVGRGTRRGATDPDTTGTEVHAR
jgi:glycosyltransferase involved in cell wall biosynthesis